MAAPPMTPPDQAQPLDLETLREIAEKASEADAKWRALVDQGVVGGSMSGALHNRIAAMAAFNNAFGPAVCLALLSSASQASRLREAAQAYLTAQSAWNDADRSGNAYTSTVWDALRQNRDSTMFALISALSTKGEDHAE